MAATLCCRISNSARVTGGEVWIGGVSRTGSVGVCSLNSRFTLGSGGEGTLRFTSSVGVSLNSFSLCASMEVPAE